MYTYKENMNNTYKCGMISIQINSLKMLKPKLNLDKTGHIWKSLWPKIDNMIQRLEMTAKSWKCELIDKKTIYNKKSILWQTTLATCKYTFYMQYLKEYYSDTRNVVTPPSEIENENIPQELKQNAINVSSLEAWKKMSSIQSDIDTELENAYKVFPIAFHAYSEYENNYPIHFLLELIKEDYMVFRDELHKMINPISQVWYKIVNAMKK